MLYYEYCIFVLLVRAANNAEHNKEDEWMFSAHVGIDN